MASKELNVIIKNRCDTSGNWTINNPVLLAGEFGVESDTGRVKVGDGLTDWSNLKYFGYDKIRDDGLSGEVRLRELSGGTYKIANAGTGSLKFYYNYGNEEDYILISDGFLVIDAPVGSSGKQFFGMGRIYLSVKNGSLQQYDGIGFIIGYTNTNNADFEISFIDNYTGPDKIVMHNELMSDGKIKKDFVDLSDVAKTNESNSFTKKQRVYSTEIFSTTPMNEFPYIEFGDQGVIDSLLVPAVNIFSLNSDSVKTQMFQDKEGIIALTSDIPTFYVEDATVTDDKLTIIKSDGTSFQFQGGGGTKIIWREWT